MKKQGEESPRKGRRKERMMQKEEGSKWHVGKKVRLERRRVMEREEC